MTKPVVKKRLSASTRWSFISIVVVLLVGCGRPVGQVTGKITYKSAPVVGAELMFQAEKDEQQFFGLSGDEGIYHVSYRTLKGLPVGSHKVTVYWFTQLNGKPLPAGEAGEALKQNGRAMRRTYEFTKEITTGANTLHLELTEGKLIETKTEPD